MAKFKVGDICIGQYLDAYACYNDCECEVVAVHPDGMVAMSQALGQILRIPPVAYAVVWADGRQYYVHEANLRKKPPRDEQLGDWEELAKLGWNTARKMAKRERDKALGVC